MKEKELFIKALSTMLYAWGGNTPSEAIWAGNELLDWYEKEHSVKLNSRLTEDEGEGTNSEAVMTAIRNN